jgi:hypothetical protein
MDFVIVLHVFADTSNSPHRAKRADYQVHTREYLADSGTICLGFLQAKIVLGEKGTFGGSQCQNSL